MTNCKISIVDKEGSIYTLIIKEKGYPRNIISLLKDTKKYSVDGIKEALGYVDPGKLDKPNLPFDFCYLIRLDIGQIEVFRTRWDTQNYPSIKEFFGTFEEAYRFYSV